VTNPFSVTKHHDGEGVVRLAVEGEIDEDVSEVLTTIVANAAGQDGVRHVVIDLGGVSFLAAAGIRSLLHGRSHAHRNGCGYRVINMTPPVERVLRVVGPATFSELVRGDLGYSPSPSQASDRKPLR
jgi:anti-anti-sigma factor